jgi:hypothetical protein
MYFGNWLNRPIIITVIKFVKIYDIIVIINNEALNINRAESYDSARLMFSATCGLGY